MTAEATITVPRSAYEALLAELEDAQDRAALADAAERERTLGKDNARRAYLPIEQVERLLAGESPLLVWREHRELSRAALERACGLPRGRLAALERGDREASAKELAALAEVLGAPFEELGAHDMASGEGRSSAPTEAATSPVVSIVASAVDEQHLYRIVRLDGGYLLTMRMRSRAGMLLGPAEWRFRTEVAARAMLQALQSFNRLWTAFTSGHPIAGLERDAAAAQDRANAAMVQLDDHPLVGDEVRDMRLRVEASLGDDAAP